MILKKRVSRIIAFIVSCAMIGFCAVELMFIVDKNTHDVRERQSKDGCIGSYGYTHDMNFLFDQLWALSNIYLRNTDDKGRFTGSEIYKKSVRQALIDLEVMNEDGELLINNPSGFEYYASCGDKRLTNTKKSPDELSSEYSIEYVRGFDQNYPTGINWSHTANKWWYTTNYGLTYYAVNGELPERAVALYDFDTTGLDYYNDYNGATIYYKTDGTTPVPENELSREYMERADREAYEYFNPDSDDHVVLPREEFDGYDHEYERDVKYIGDMSEVTDTGAYLFYDDNHQCWYKVDKSKFIRTDGSNSDISIYIRPSDAVIADYEQYAAHRTAMETESVHKAMPLIPVAAVGGIIGIILLFCCGYSAEKKKFVMSMPDYLFAELPILIIIASGIIVFSFIRNGDGSLQESINSYYSFDMAGIVIGGCTAAVYAVCLGCVITLITRLKCHSFWKTTLTGRIAVFCWKGVKKIAGFISAKLRQSSIRRIERDALRNDQFMRRFIIRTAIAAVIGGLIFIAFLSTRDLDMLAVCTLLLLAGYVYFSIRDHVELAGVSKQIADMNGGDYTPRTVPEKSPAYGMTNNLNNIADGMKSAVDRQVKSERMKIELVTNVSHDLKTPLTSIISYIDLLADEEMSPAAKDYVTIISQKSDRLKTMVSDLFDLAKATSRSDVNAEELDAVILTQQVIGDMSDKIAQSGRDIRTDIQVHTAPVMAEGKKLYRVFQNLIDNALKYSMEGTRIYITLTSNGTDACVSVKNIAAEEMNFTPEEIVERFTRGDQSRTTEGNGLGLSIAKSFTEACGGRFNVIIDGDMFTATVELPLKNKE